MKTIQTDTHLLLVDETAEIGDYGYWENTNIIAHITDIKATDSTTLKIIAASPKLGDLPEFETLPPNTEDDVEKLADDYAKKMCDKVKWVNDRERMGFYNGCRYGYKQAKSETMFSFGILNLLKENGYYDDAVYDLIKDYIESLTKPKEYEFVVEMEDTNAIGITDGGRSRTFYGKQPKIVANKIYGEWKQKN